MYVYVLTNKLNNKKYVGITTRNLNVRFLEHLRGFKTDSNKILYQAIQKYGKENFKIELKDTAKTIEELKQKEIYYIEKLNTYYKKNKGYNKTKGGDTAESGEDNPKSKLINREVKEIKNLLKTTNLTFIEICNYLKLNVGPNQIHYINNGNQWHDKDLEYPIRKNPKSIGKQRENNPSNKIKKEDALKIIELLSTTSRTQNSISEEFKVHTNTINNINRCIIWNELHGFKENIRKESGLKTKNSKSKVEKEKILEAIKLLSETEKTQKEISAITGIGTVSLSKLNNCSKWKELHSFKSNIRMESRKESGK